MTTTPVHDQITIAPHCTMTSCWSADVHELHDAKGNVIAHYCPEHKEKVSSLRQSNTVTLCEVTVREVAK